MAIWCLCALEDGWRGGWWLFTTQSPVKLMRSRLQGIHPISICQIKIAVHSLSSKWASSGKGRDTVQLAALYLGGRPGVLQIMCACTWKQHRLSAPTLCMVLHTLSRADSAYRFCYISIILIIYPILMGKSLDYSNIWLFWVTIMNM